MSVELLEIIGEDRALFGNDAIQAQNLGDFTWSELTDLTGGTWSVVVNGVDVEGNAFEEQEIEIEISGEINETKIFWAIVAVIKEIVCSECI